MEENEPKPTEQTADLTASESLEDTVTDPAQSAGISQTGKIDATTGGTDPEKPHKRSAVRRFLGRFNIYLLLLVLLVLIAGIIVLVAFIANRRDKNVNVQTQSLSENTLKQLAASDVTVGQPKQVLNVQSNAVFAGKVLIRDSLEVAGPIQVGGNLSIPGITVSGNSVFDQVQISKNLSVAGDSALQGQLSIQKSLSVAGGGTFGGAITAPQVTANTLQLNGDLNITHHITAGGATPGRSNGGALGSGGAASVSGSDTAGSINVNTGSGAAAGCFVTINFTQKYNATPHVLVTPIGSAAGNLGFYVNRSTSGFSVCAANTPPSSASFGFDYFVLD